MDKKYYSHEKFQKRYKNYLRERAEDEEERNVEAKEIDCLREKFEDDGELDPEGCIDKVIKEEGLNDIFAFVKPTLLHPEREMTHAKMWSTASSKKYFDLKNTNCMRYTAHIPEGILPQLIS